MGTSKLTPEQIVELVRRYESGEPLQDLCEAFGISRQGINLIVKKHGNGPRTGARRQIDVLAVQMALNDKLVAENAALKEQLRMANDEIKFLRKMLDKKS